MPQPAFSDFKVLVGRRKIAFDALVFVADIGDFGLGLDNLIGQQPRMIAKLAIGRKKLGLLQLKHPLRSQPAASFLCQFVGKAHPCPPRQG